MMDVMTNLLFEGADPVVEVFKEEPEEVFICSIVGAVTIDILKRIEEEINNSVSFNNCDGIYTFKCNYEPAQYDGETFGFIQGDDWSVEQIKYESFEVNLQ